MFYAEAEKLIYEAPDGRRFDPLALRRALVVAGRGGLNASLDAWSSETATDLERAAAEGRLVAAAREAFGLRPFDADGGATDATALAALDHFLRWLEGNACGGRTPRS